MYLINFYKNIINPNFKYMINQNFYFSLLPKKIVLTSSKKWNNNYIKFKKNEAIESVSFINTTLQTMGYMAKLRLHFPTLEETFVIRKIISKYFWVYCEDELWLCNDEGKLYSADDFVSQYICLVYRGD